ncbi:hypothetical protein HDU85_003540 [Gaertneriomyces sp. JEL0708]|nr:hypothetical protein HDU85_003540 [Gaertneriomyces sp. JEL0708]
MQPPSYIPLTPSFTSPRSSLGSESEPDFAAFLSPERPADGPSTVDLGRPKSQLLWQQHDWDPYAEPADAELAYAQDEEPERWEPNPSGNRVTEMLRSLLPVEDEPPTYIHPVYRAYHDTPFAVLFVGAFATWFLTGFIYTVTTTADSTWPKPVYTAVKNSWGVLVVTGVIAFGIGVGWLGLLRKYVRPVVFSTILLLPLASFVVFLTLTIKGVNGKAQHPLLSAQYDSMIVAGVLGLFSGLASTAFLVMRRREVEQTVHILELSCDILRTNPHLLVFSLMSTLVYIGFAAIWVTFFTHLFLRGWADGPTWHISGGTPWLAFFFLGMYFWTDSVIRNIEKTVVAGVVGEWYFRTHEIPQDIKEDRTTKNLKAALTTNFGSVCFASLILGTVKAMQHVTSLIKRATRRDSSNPSQLHRFLTSCTDCWGHLAENVTTYALVHVGLTGSSFWKSSYITTRIFRRNLVLGLITNTVTRIIVAGIAAIVAGCAGAVGWWISTNSMATGDQSGQTGIFGGGLVVGVFAGGVGWGVVRVLGGIVQNTVDATYICYLLDIDTNTVHCQNAHRIFGASGL